VVTTSSNPAAGKGVIIAADRSESHKAIDFMFEGGFGESGQAIVVEEFMEGEEASFFALSDGRNVVPLAGAQDHKRVGDGDTGPNTGGMGAYSPAPVLTAALEQVAMEQFIKPTVAAMAAKGRPYMGVLYLGLMITRQGPKLVEYNARFGDPECQVLMPRLKSDLLAALLAAREGKLQPLPWRDETALTVVMASKGYPGAYEKGHVISGLDEAAKLPGIILFHAGTEQQGSDIVAVGGRVLNVTALGKDVAEARLRAYAAVDLIHWDGAFHRRDIGWRALNR
jgi:phosphoribosylamine---glycine ligase